MFISRKNHLFRSYDKQMYIAKICIFVNVNDRISFTSQWFVIVIWVEKIKINRISFNVAVNIVILIEWFEKIKRIKWFNVIIIVITFTKYRLNSFSYNDRNDSLLFYNEICYIACWLLLWFNELVINNFVNKRNVCSTSKKWISHKRIVWCSWRNRT